MSDLSIVKDRQRQMWAAGDYAAVATPLLIVSELLCEAVDLRAGRRVLDVAAGSGNTTLAAARRRCETVGIDYVAALLDRARDRAAVERIHVRLEEGDAENLSFADGSFDFVLSTFGVMFAPDQPRAAGELVRVCRPGGRIGLASWTPEGFVGQWFQLCARHAPPPPGVRTPLAWGTQEGLRELLGDAGPMRTERRLYVMRYPSPEHWLSFFRANFGPVKKAFESMDAAAQERFAAEQLELVRKFNRSGDDTLVLPGEYLEAVIDRR